jgi:uncharacterized delta-60 repeat protein
MLRKQLKSFKSCFLSCNQLESRTNPTSFVLDANFGIGGRAFPSIAGATFSDVADTEIGSDGKIWVLGTLNNLPALARFLPNGKADTTFDGDGIKTWGALPNAVLNYSKLSLLPGNESIVMGVNFITVSTPDFIATKLDANGSLVTTFGDNGNATINIPSAFNLKLDSAEVLASGQVLLAGSALPNSKDSIGNDEFGDPIVPLAPYRVVKLTGNGKLDNTFGKAGIAEVAGLGTDDSGKSRYTKKYLASSISSDGMVSILGSRGRTDVSITFPPGSPSVSSDVKANLIATVFRINSKGQADTTFSSDGYAETTLIESPIGIINVSVTVTLSAGASYALTQTDNGLVVGINTTNFRSVFIPDGSNGQDNFHIVRFGANGKVDSSFGSNGEIVQNLRIYGGLLPPLPERKVTGFHSLTNGTLSMLQSISTPDPTGKTSTVYTKNWTRFSASGQLLDETKDGIVLHKTSKLGDTIAPKFIFPISNNQLIAVGLTDETNNNDSITKAGVERLIVDTTAEAVANKTIFTSQANGKVTRLTYQQSAPFLNDLALGSTEKPFANYSGVVQALDADINGDGVLDNVFVQSTGPTVGDPVLVRFNKLDGSSQSQFYSPFEKSFLGGVSVTVAQLDSSVQKELIFTAGNGGGSRVQITNINALSPIPAVDEKAFNVLRDFFGIEDLNFRGGAKSTVADINGDGKKELIVAAGEGGGPRVAIFDGSTLFSTTTNFSPRKLREDFFVFEQTLRNGVTLNGGDLNSDGRDDVVFGAGNGGAPRIFVADGKQLNTGTLKSIADFFVSNNSTSRNGTQTVLRDINNDGKLDLATVRDSFASPVVYKNAYVIVYDGATIASAVDQPELLRGFDFGNTAGNGVYVS